MTTTTELTGRESRRFQLLRFAQEYAKEPAGSVVAPFLSHYAQLLSYLPPDQAAVTFEALAFALREQRMGDVSEALNELLAGVE